MLHAISICLNIIVPAVGISAVQKQQEKLQNGAQLPGHDIAQNRNLHFLLYQIKLRQTYNSDVR
jgi:hypothetical protein